MFDSRLLPTKWTACRRRRFNGTDRSVSGQPDNDLRRFLAGLTPRRRCSHSFTLCRRGVKYERRAPRTADGGKSNVEVINGPQYGPERQTDSQSDAKTEYRLH